MASSAHAPYAFGDPERIPLSGALPSPAALEAAFAPLILSASGWRKVFSESGDEESHSPEIGDANRILAALMADVFADYLIERKIEKDLILGRDARPTGEAMADAMCRVFLARGIRVRYLGISAAPEIMAYAREHGSFAYVSASHNPIGHNGVKFGLSDGGVLEGGETRKLIAFYRALVARKDAAERARDLIASCPTASLKAVACSIETEKARAIETYRAFSREVISGESEPAKQERFLGALAEGAQALSRAGKPLSFLADFNGSARAASIDRSFFESFGIRFFAINDAPGQIAHRIVPEGDSLSFCAREIERLRKEGSTDEERAVSLGYMPDCDGDRGNIVCWNAAKGAAETLEAQEVFALSVIAELAHLAWAGTVSCTPGKAANPPVAVAVNDPTSLRIEAIARAFGARVARAEVGEANVVNLARRLRGEGAIVRILGEGSNGGNITHPAAVRDPLNTAFALIKLLLIRDANGKKGLFHIWCELSGQEGRYRDDFDLTDIRATLPLFVTTSVYEPEAMLAIKTADHALLKRNFQAVFLREWDNARAGFLADLGVASWQAIANNGTEETRGIADFGLSGKGGLKVQFLDSAGAPCAYIWMRGSGTEPVFRILADARGSDVSAERRLLSWLTAMVLEADRA
ncbi:MAG TPA: phosphoglucomutase [Treponemataceae bacterium]|nr:phosphoglucomutase [Treponemataceae bacterium]